MKKNVIRVFAASMASVLVMVGCGKEEALPELKEASYQAEGTVKAQYQDIEDVEFYKGFVAGDLQILSFQRSGVLKDVQVSVGTEIHKGDVIAVLSNDELDEQIAEIESQISDRINQKTDNVALIQNGIAQKNLEKKYSENEEEKTVCDIEIRKYNRQIQYEEQLCDLELEELYVEKDNLVKEQQKDKIVAPSDGQIIDLALSEIGEGFIQVGEEITADKGIVFFEGSEKKYLVSSDDESGIDTEGRRLVCRYSDETFELKEKKYGKAVRTAAEKLGYNLRQRFEAVDKDAKLDLGKRVLFEVHENEKKQALTVPKNALKNGVEEQYVYVVKDGKKEKRNVTIGTVTTKYIEITEGLQEGEEVAIYRSGGTWKEGQEYTEVSVQRGDLIEVDNIEETADKMNLEIQQVKFSGETGEFQKLAVKEGDMVKAGDIVAYVKGSVKESEVLQAEMSLEEAVEARKQIDKDTSEQLKELNESLGKAKEQYEKESLRLQIQAVNLQYTASIRNANVAVEKARKEYNQLYEQNSGCPIRAGISGQVIFTTQLKKGDIITGGSDIICNIAKTSATYYNIPYETYDTNCKIMITDTEGKEYKAKVIGAYRYFEYPTGGDNIDDWYNTRIVLDKQLDVDEDIAIEDIVVERMELKDVVCVSSDAVISFYQGSIDARTEYVNIKKGDTVEQQDVIVGYWGMDDNCYIYSGLEEGDVLLCYDLQ